MTVGQADYLQQLSDGQLCISDLHMSCNGLSCIYLRQENRTFGQATFTHHLPHGQVDFILNFEACMGIFLRAAFCKGLNQVATLVPQGLGHTSKMGSSNLPTIGANIWTIECFYLFPWTPESIRVMEMVRDKSQWYHNWLGMAFLQVSQTHSHLY